MMLSAYLASIGIQLTPEQCKTVDGSEVAVVAREHLEILELAKSHYRAADIASYIDRGANSTYVYYYCARFDIPLTRQQTKATNVEIQAAYESLRENKLPRTALLDKIATKCACSATHVHHVLCSLGILVPERKRAIMEVA